MQPLNWTVNLHTAQHELLSQNIKWCSIETNRKVLIPVISPSKWFLRTNQTGSKLAIVETRTEFIKRGALFKTQQFFSGVSTHLNLRQTAVLLSGNYNSPIFFTYSREIKHTRTS